MCPTAAWLHPLPQSKHEVEVAPCQTTGGARSSTAPDYQQRQISRCPRSPAVPGQALLKLNGLLPVLPPHMGQGVAAYWRGVWNLGVVGVGEHDLGEHEGGAGEQNAVSATVRTPLLLHSNPAMQPHHEL